MLKGKIHKYGDNINTDVIIPSRYCTTIKEEELAKYCLADLDKDFINQVKRNDIILAGNNFGCGSSREVAPIAIKAAGVSCVIAKSFARIFYRNAINIGLAILESKEAYDKINNQDEIEIDYKNGKIKNLTTMQTFASEPFPEFLQEIIHLGGLIQYVKFKMR
jgi:3-isopropylmalate/(R)-2-methylmalate dehydratase small subunit